MLCSKPSFDTQPSSDLFAALPDGPVAVAVSGGVDSLCALVLTRQTGREVIALHARLWEEDAAASAEHRQTVERLAAVCKQLGVRFHLADLRALFAEKVVQPFVHAYGLGLTPNPCALCNRSIKFGALWQEARNLGAAGLVTGHYASLDRQHPYRGAAPLLGKARDAGKDQSYFLGLVPRQILAHVAFPLAQLEKNAVRALVLEQGLTIPQPKESQEICFVPNDPAGYRNFMASRVQRLSGTGSILELDSGKCLGEHKGLWQYTEGQRRGLGIAWSEPLYVIAKDVGSNTLYVGGKRHTRVETAWIGNINLMVGQDELPKQAQVRLRYRQRPVPARVEFPGKEQWLAGMQAKGGSKPGLQPADSHPQGCPGDGQDGTAGMVLHLEKPLDISAPGQIAVVQDDEGRVLAAGTIAALA